MGVKLNQMVTCLHNYKSDHRHVRMWFSSCCNEDILKVAVTLPYTYDIDVPVFDEAPLVERVLSCSEMTMDEVDYLSTEDFL